MCIDRLSRKRIKARKAFYAFKIVDNIRGGYYPSLMGWKDRAEQTGYKDSGLRLKYKPRHKTTEVPDSPGIYLYRMMNPADMTLYDYPVLLVRVPKGALLRYSRYKKIRAFTASEIVAVRRVVCREEKWPRTQSTSFYKLYSPEDLMKIVRSIERRERRKS